MDDEQIILNLAKEEFLISEDKENYTKKNRNGGCNFRIRKRIYENETHRLEVVYQYENEINMSNSGKIKKITNNLTIK